MNILFDLNHPSYVHTFKYILCELSRKGHKCLISAREKEFTHRLLEEYSIPYFSTGKTPRSNTMKKVRAVFTVLRLCRLIRHYRIDLVVSMESPYAVAAAAICHIRSLTLADTETAKTIHRITGRYSTTILVPSCFTGQLSPRQTVFRGYKELAYLHPHRFSPDPEVLQSQGIDPGRPFALVRFVAFRAAHDKGLSGFTEKNKILLAVSLSAYMDVYISSEVPLPPEIEKFRLPVSPGDIHHLLAFARLFAGESMTMSAEAAVLGIPSICLNYMELGYIRELSDRYGLVFKFGSSLQQQGKAIDKALELAITPPEPGLWQQRREKMLKEKIDVTSFVVSLIESGNG